MLICLIRNPIYFMSLRHSILSFSHNYRPFFFESSHFATPAAVFATTVVGRPCFYCLDLNEINSYSKLNAGLISTNGR